MEKSRLYDSLIIASDKEEDIYIAKELVKRIKKFKAPRLLHLEQDRVENIYFCNELEHKESEQYQDFLNGAEWLILICSPTSKNSEWCNRIIDEFAKKHDPSHILAVLSEGEPVDSFPEQVLYRNITVENRDGTKRIIREKIEPLAANFRGTSKKEINKNIDDEYLKLLAPIMGVYYDDLKQRHREQRLKRLRVVFTFVAVFVFAITVYSTISFTILSRQQKNIEKQVRELEYNNAISLAGQSLEQIKKNNSGEAKRLALASAEAVEAAGLDYLADTHAALLQSHAPYSSGDLMKAEYTLSLQGKVLNVWTDEADSSSELTTVVLYDESNTLTIWNVSENKIIRQISDVQICLYENIDSARIVSSAVFVEGGYFAYADQGGIRILRVEDGKEERFIDNCEVDALFTYYGYIFTLKDCNIGLLDTEEWTGIYDLALSTRDIFENRVYVSNTYLAYSTQTEKGAELNLFEVATGSSTSFSFDYDAITVRDVIALEDGCFVQVNCYRKSSNGNYKYVNSNVALYYSGNGSGPEKEWEAFSNLKGSGIGICQDQEENSYIFTTNTSILTIFDFYGNELESFHLDGTALWVDRVYGDVLLQNGDYFFSRTYYAKTSEKSWETESIITENYLSFNGEVMDAAKVFRCGNGFVLVPKDSNRVLAYGNNTTQDYETEYAVKVSIPASKVLSQKEAIAYAEQYSIAYPSLVDAILFDEDNGYVIVSYSNGRAASYKADGGECIDNWDLVEDVNLSAVDKRQQILGYDVLAKDYDRAPFTSSITTCLGEDREGNTYYRGTRYGYILNKEHRFLAAVEFLYGFDREKDEIVIGYTETPAFMGSDMLDAACYLKTFSYKELSQKSK